MISLRDAVLETAKKNVAWEKQTLRSTAARFCDAGIISDDDFLFLHLVRLACRQPEPTWKFMRKFGYMDSVAADRFYSLYETFAEARGIIYFADRSEDPRHSKHIEMLEDFL